MNKSVQKIFYDNIAFVENDERSISLNSKFNKMINHPAADREAKYILLELAKVLYQQSDNNKSSEYYKKAVAIQSFLKQNYKTTSRGALEKKVAMIIESFKEAESHHDNISQPLPEKEPV